MAFWLPLIARSKSFSLAIGPHQTICGSAYSLKGQSGMPPASAKLTANASIFAFRSTKACREWPDSHSPGEWLGCSHKQKNERHPTLTASSCPKYAATCSSCHRTMEVPSKGYASWKLGRGTSGDLTMQSSLSIVWKSHQYLYLYTYIFTD